MRILFIRHGESTGNVARRMAGQSHDGLSPKGVQQSTQLAQWLYDQGWQPSHIYTSPLRRAMETLHALAMPWAWSLPAAVARPSLMENAPNAEGQYPATAGHPAVTVTAHLAEFQAGVFTGLTWVEAQARYPQLCAALIASPDWIPIPEAETPASGRDRACYFIQHLLNQADQADDIWVISHHWILEHLIASLLGCNRTWQISIPNTGLFEFELDCDRWYQSGMAPWTQDLWQIKRFGDCPHLPSPSDGASP